MAASSVPPDTFGAPSATLPTNRSGWASKDDWNNHQILIGQLYSQHSLAEVMTFMEKAHKFKATEKMYKTRIKQWGLDKKHKEKEMRAIVRKAKTLGNQGKSATFRVRGRPIDSKDVVRYFKRKEIRIEDIIDQPTKSKTPEAVDCFISLPSPITTPELVAIPERILVRIRNYICGSFENGTWVTTDLRRVCETTKVQGHPSDDLGYLFAHYLTACGLFENMHYEEGGQSLKAACSKIEGLVLADHPDTLGTLFRIVVLCVQRERDEIARIALKHYSDLTKVMVGDAHPLEGICRWLASIAPYELETVIMRCGASMADHFESIAGPLNITTLSCRLIFFRQEVDTEHDMNQKLVLLKDILHKCENFLEPFDTRTCEVRLHLAWHYIGRVDHVEALKVGWDVITHAKHFIQSSGEVHFCAEGFYIVARCQYAMKDTHSAEINLRRAIDLSISRYGSTDSRLKTLLTDLEEWLIVQGQWSSASQVQERRKEAFSDCTDANV